MKQSGRVLTATEAAAAIEVVETCRGLSREELAHTVCEHLNWVTVTGRHKMTACMSLLEKLEREGRLRLPEKRRYRRKGTIIEGWSERTGPGEEVDWGNWGWCRR